MAIRAPPPTTATRLTNSRITGPWPEEELAKGDVKKEGDRPDAIPIDDALKIVNRARSLVSLEPLKGDTFEFWGPEEVLKSFEFSSGDKIRITTKGDSFFIEAITISDGAKPSSFRGDVRVGQNWTDKLLQVKAQDEDGPLPQDKMEGVADDEWD